MMAARGLLATRAAGPEQMDAVDLPAPVYARVLADLARVNRWTLAARPTLAFLARAAAGRDAVSLLDVGFGHGDMLRRIARWCGRHGIGARLVGVDLNPGSEPIARGATPAGLAIDYRTADAAAVAREEAGPGFDLIVSSLVAHHMADAELVGFVRMMETRAKVGWLINDLRRSRLSHAGYPWLARLLGCHPIVREDGRLSIARSFTNAEWRGILVRAGVPAGAARIVRRFPFRLCVERLR